MLLAIPIAIIAGLVSFASPCVLPLVPGYLGYVSGMAGATSITDDDSHRRKRRHTTVLGAGLFVLGFTLVFVVFGVIAGSLGVALAQWQTWIERGLGEGVVLVGSVLFGGLGWVPRERRLAHN